MRYSGKSIIFGVGSNLDQVYGVGDIHGNFIPFIDDIINSCKFRNCVVIVCGDCGFGFYSPKKMQEYFQKMQTMVSPYNVYIIFFRGNHDDPEWFKYKDDEFALNYKNIIIAEDFTIVKFFDYNILLWGGGISIDRYTRMQNISYWKDEYVKPLPSTFDTDMNSEESLDIRCVCTHSAPDFCLPINSDGISGFFRRDNTLEFDVNDERQTISKGAYVLKRSNPRLELWIYGHFHDTLMNYNTMNDEIYRFSGITFVGLDMFREKYDKERMNKIHYNKFDRKNKNDFICIVNYR